jgi:transcriptional regulator with XRE-family HTH domain
MKKQPKIPNEHLVGAPYTYALEVARAMSGKTYEQIAHEMDLGRETIHRYFTDPDYQPPTKRLPKLCKVLGNDIILDWVCLNAEGYFVRVPCGAGETSLDIQIAQLTKDFSDVLQADGDARLDRKYTAGELERIDRELSELIVKGQQYRNAIRRMIPVP